MGFFKKVFKSVGKLAKGILGLDTGEDLGKKFDQQLQAQQEANKLSAANEVQNVAQFDDSGGDTFSGSDTRRKKRGAGAYANALGLQV